jgi:hypothetical protein
MRYKEFAFDPLKSLRLRKERGLGFEEVIGLIERGHLVDVVRHPNVEKYPRQFLFVVEVKDYLYLVPFVPDGERAFLKTLFPSRKATKKRRKGLGGEKKASS